MNWTEITEVSMLDQIRELSESGKVMIFKHSTTCSISATALNRLERNWKEEEMAGIKPFFLNLLKYREISNQIASHFGVEHQSPQVIVLSKGKVIYHTSHNGINYLDLKEMAERNELLA